MRAEEALSAVHYFIDDAILLEQHRVRILHGTGTGALAHRYPPISRHRRRRDPLPRRRHPFRRRRHHRRRNPISAAPTAPYTQRSNPQVGVALFVYYSKAKRTQTIFNKRAPIGPSALLLDHTQLCTHHNFRQTSLV